MAEELYYHKGTSYADSVNLNGNKSDLNGSTVIMSVSTIYPGNFQGKERVRLFARCQYVEDYFDAYGCKALTGSMGIHPTYSTVNNFVSQMSPRETSFTNPIDSIFWWIKSPYVSATFNTLYAVSAYSKGWVDHSTPTNYTSGRINLNNLSVDLSKIQLPTNYTYDKVDSYFHDKEGGLLGTFTYNYGLQPGQVGYITARGYLEYEMRIPGETSASFPIPIWVTTDEAKVNHTVTGK